MSEKAIAAIEALLPSDKYRIVGRNVINAGSQEDPNFLWATLWVNREVNGSSRAGRVVIRVNGDVELFGEKLANLRELGSSGKSKIVDLIEERFTQSENTSKKTKKKEKN